MDPEENITANVNQTCSSSAALHFTGENTFHSFFSLYPTHHTHGLFKRIHGRSFPILQILQRTALPVVIAFLETAERKALRTDYEEPYFKM